MSKEKAENSSDAKVEIMKNLFDEQRNSWQKKIKQYTGWLKIPEKLITLEITVRNEIMNAMDEKAKLLEAMVTISKIVRKKKADTMIDIKTNSDIKLKNQTEQIILLESALTDYMEREELISMQIEYMDRLFNNLKDILWGISRYIELNKMGIE